MDNHSGFSTNEDLMLSEEDKLTSESDMVLVTAQKLLDERIKRNNKCAIVRNAVDYNHFNVYLGQPPKEVLGLTGPIIGYYGAISDWFDVEMVEYIAEQRPNWNVILIGNTFGADVANLKLQKNVLLLGEIPYHSLPGYLHSFDVCIIPFKINPLTEATNPVKFYEYLSAGKPVVSVELPELMPYSSSLVYIGKDNRSFLDAIKKALQDNTSVAVQERMKFAKCNTWEKRVADIVELVENDYDLVSIIILTYNNLHLTEQCINSIVKFTSYPNYELVIVDNASNDGTVDYLKKLVAEKNNVKVIFNTDNNGFAGANNQGIKESSGKYIILLNNDTIVSPNWLGKLITYLNSNDEFGMVGPVTNCIGNEAMVPTNYNTLAGMLEFAEQYTISHEGRVFEIKVLAMYCVAMRRSLFNEIGYLDESFAIGMFEDDDFSLRVKNSGYKVICAEDVFIHHFNRSSFKLLSEQEYKKIFEANKQLFENKWEIKWDPHKFRRTN
jgi:GT2 family glycosyltransferase